MKELPGGRWSSTRPLSLLRWDLSGNLVGYGGSHNVEKVLAENPLEGAGPTRHMPLPDNLGGAVVIDAKLYVSLRKENRILVVDPSNGNTTGELKLAEPGLLANDRGGLLAFSGDALVKFDLKSASLKPLFKPALRRRDAIPTRHR